MTAASPIVPAWVAKLLAILSVAFFWILPSSPPMAIAALLATKHSTGWPRRLAVIGAVLSIAFTLAAAAILAWLAVTSA
jgi:hypothetical protein